MPKIPIKIKRSGSLINKISDEIKVDLRRKNQEPRQKQSFKKRLFLVVAPFLIIMSLFFVYFLFFSKSNFRDLIPQEPIIFSLIDQKMFYQKTIPFLKNNNQDIARIGEYWDQIKLGFEDIQPLFKKQFAFALLSSRSETDLPFVLIFETQASSDKIDYILSKIESGLRDDCNSFSRVYRQVEIRSLKPVVSSSSVLSAAYYYAQAEKYLVISSSQEILEAIIDKIIDG